MRQCERCGTGFEPKFLGKSNEQRFCTDYCARRHGAIRRNAMKPPKKQIIQVNFCHSCNAEVKSSGGGRPREYCSNQCATKRRRELIAKRLVTRTCQCCYGIFVIKSVEQARYCSQFCRGFMQEKWPRPVKRQAYDPRNDGKLCSSVECDKPVTAKELCIRHYSVMRMATGKRPRYPFTCEVCHCPGESWDKQARMHQACSARTSQKRLVMSRSTEIAIIESRRYLARPINVLPKGQILFSGNCRNCKQPWVDYNLRQSCSDECSDALHGASRRKAKLRKKESNESKGLPRNYGRSAHRSRAKKYGVAHESGITPLSVFEASRWICQLCFGYVDPRESTGIWRPTLDHVIPMARGGAHVRENLQLAHMICNSYKGKTVPPGP
jgi:hypothetical protein